MQAKRNMVLLVITALVWGVAFVFQSQGGELLGPYAFVCLRCLLAGLAMLPAIRLFERLGLAGQAPRNRREWGQLLLGGVCCGLCLSGIFLCQQVGMYLGTAPGKAGFLTACYVVLVPVLGVFLKKRCGWRVWAAVVITVAGLWLLCMEGTLSLRLSDGLVLLCSLCNALHILVIDHFTRKVDPVRMSCVQFFTVALVSLVPMALVDLSGGLAQWLTAFRNPQSWIALLYAGLVSSAIGFTLQCVGQKGVDPTVASLLMSLESVFAVLAGWLMLGDVMSLRALGGCALILAAVVLAQLPDRTEKHPTP